MNPNITVAACSPGSPSSTVYTIHVSDSEDVGKRRRKRTIISAEQLTKLESLYVQEQWPNRERKEKLAKEIGMSTHFVNIWFQNKRSRMKKMAQEEAELASLRQSMSQTQSESESQQSQTSMTSVSEKEASSTTSNSIKSSGNGTPTVHVVKLSTPSRVGPKPILPSRMPAQSNFKAVLSDLKLTSPQVVCVKLPLTTSQSAVSSSPDHSAAPKKIKLESINPEPVLPNAKPAEYRDIVDMAITSELLQTDSQTQSGSAVLQQTVSSSADAIQKIAVIQSQNQMYTQHQHMPQAHKPPQVRFACSSSAVMPPRNTLPPPSDIDNHQVSSQESNSSYSTQSIASHNIISTPASSSHDMYQSLPTSTSYNLFDCLVAMAAIEEGGGIVQRDDPIYDIAVNSALYGIKVEEDVILTHDKQKGLRFAETEG